VTNDVGPQLEEFETLAAWIEEFETGNKDLRP
jgi:hypothetical protein